MQAIDDYDYEEDSTEIIYTSDTWGREKGRLTKKIKDLEREISRQKLQNSKLKSDLVHHSDYIASVNENPQARAVTCERSFSAW